MVNIFVYKQLFIQLLSFKNTEKPSPLRVLLTQIELILIEKLGCKKL